MASARAATLVGSELASPAKLHRLDENLGALGVKLTEDDLRDIDRAASGISIHGDHYPAWMEQTVGH